MKWFPANEHAMSTNDIREEIQKEIKKIHGDKMYSWVSDIYPDENSAVVEFEGDCFIVDYVMKDGRAELGKTCSRAEKAYRMTEDGIPLAKAFPKKGRDGAPKVAKY